MEREELVMADGPKDENANVSFDACSEPPTLNENPPGDSTDFPPPLEETPIPPVPKEEETPPPRITVLPIVYIPVGFGSNSQPSKKAKAPKKRKMVPLYSRGEILACIDAFEFTHLQPMWYNDVDRNLGKHYGHIISTKIATIPVHNVPTSDMENFIKQIDIARNQ